MIQGTWPKSMPKVAEQLATPQGWQIHITSPCGQILHAAEDLNTPIGYKAVLFTKTLAWVGLELGLRARGDKLRSHWADHSSVEDKARELAHCLHLAISDTYWISEKGKLRQSIPNHIRRWTYSDVRHNKCEEVPTLAIFLSSWNAPGGERTCYPL